MGDTCAFCLTLASRGWQRQSKKARDRHASHIHANCDCEYCVRFDGKSTVQGYDPDALLEQYYAAEGNTPQEKINAIRRAHYAENAPTIRAQKRAAYARRMEREKGLLYGGNHGTMQIAEPVKRITAIAASSVTEKVQSGEYSLRLTRNSYNKHVEGHPDYERYRISREGKNLPPQGVLIIPFEEAQDIILKKSGTGIINVKRDGTPTNVEDITCDRIIGKCWYRGQYYETHKAAIHHGSSGSHLVPHYGGNYD